jgi:phosphate transport system permease protein
VVLAVLDHRSGLPAFTQYVVEVEFTLTQEQFDEAESQLLKTGLYEASSSKPDARLRENGLEVAVRPDAIERLDSARSAAHPRVLPRQPGPARQPVTFELPPPRAWTAISRAG